MENVRKLLEEAIAEETLISAVASGARKRGEDRPRKVTVKPVTVRGEHRYQFESHYERKVTHLNLSPEETAAHLVDLAQKEYGQVQVFTKNSNFHILINKKGEATVQARPPTRQAAETSHNRAKQYLIPEGEPCDFLARLGVMSESGAVLAAKRDKFRQINRFLEMVEDVAPHLPPEGPLRIVDFGCGKSYLTFALYHYFRRIRGRDVDLVGLDLKRDVVETCRQIADDLGLEGLSFEVGDIRGYGGPDRADMVVSLHACDTATDDALARAVKWDASVILSVPCCQHELFKKIENPAMRPMLKHGIVRERLSALITDSLRAEMLEIAGYSVQLLEFIDAEHTPKNLLIRAVRAQHEKEREKRIKEYQVFREFWHLSPYIETVMDLPPEVDFTTETRRHGGNP